MSQMVSGPARAVASAHPLPRRHGLLRDLERPGDAFAQIGPNWFASVMGTGIVATAAATLPVQWPGLRGFAAAVWVLGAAWLIALTGAEIVLWTRHRAAANLLGGVAHLALPPPFGTAFAAFGVVYGVPVWGFAALWAALAAGLTVRAARRRLPFTLSWWSFTFPVGTCVTAASGLALHIGADAFRWAAVALYIALVGAWAVVGVRTARGTWRGRLFLPPPPEPGQ